jgi:hypothetical protein
LFWYLKTSEEEGSKLKKILKKLEETEAKIWLKGRDENNK